MAKKLLSWYLDSSEVFWGHWQRRAESCSLMKRPLSRDTCVISALGTCRKTARCSLSRCSVRTLFKSLIGWGETRAIKTCQLIGPFVQCNKKNNFLSSSVGTVTPLIPSFILPLKILTRLNLKQVNYDLCSFTSVDAACEFSLCLSPWYLK